MLWCFLLEVHHTHTHTYSGARRTVCTFIRLSKNVRKRTQFRTASVGKMVNDERRHRNKKRTKNVMSHVAQSVYGVI